MRLTGVVLFLASLLPFADSASATETTVHASGMPTEAYLLKVRAQAMTSEGHPPRNQVRIPEEPEEYDQRELNAFYDWRNDLFFRHFDMGGIGRIDFMTARRTYRVWLDEFGTPVVLTVANPLFYWVDTNGNGEFESELGEMFSDPEEDGINGNERLYDLTDLKSPGPPAYPFVPRSPGL